jgi:hypothetical protein
VARKKSKSGTAGVVDEGRAATAEGVALRFTSDELIEILNGMVFTAFHAIEDDDESAWRCARLTVDVANKIEVALPEHAASDDCLCAEELATLRQRVAKKFAGSRASVERSPCDENDHYWIGVHNERVPGKDAATSGKWLMYIDCPWIQKVWTQVVADVRAGLLGPSAKVSTHRPSPLSARPEKHVVCVYTKSWKDHQDVLRVARQLVTTASLKRMKISYKSDEQTLAGEYQGNSPDGVALYSFGPPYQELALLRAG